MILYKNNLITFLKHLVCNDTNPRFGHKEHANGTLLKRSTKGNDERVSATSSAET
jgi:hypothetical protein